jgi:hypothetical protein
MRFSLLFLTACSCAAQSLTLGAIGGVRATNDIAFDATSESKRYIAGPMIELGLPFQFAFEFDALYSREGFRASNSTPLATTNIDSHSNVWQLPVLVKHSIPVPLLKPFAEIGYAPRFMSGTLNASGSFLASPEGPFQPFSSSQATNWATSQGLVLGAGVRLHAGRLQFMPEARYTRWNNAPVSYTFPDGPTVSSSQNEFDVFLGIGWRALGR